MNKHVIFGGMLAAALIAPIASQARDVGGDTLRGAGRKEPSSGGSRVTPERAQPRARSGACSSEGFAEIAERNTGRSLV